MIAITNGVTALCSTMTPRYNRWFAQCDRYVTHKVAFCHRCDGASICHNIQGTKDFAVAGDYVLFYVKGDDLTMVIHESSDLITRMCVYNPASPVALVVLEGGCVQRIALETGHVIDVMGIGESVRAVCQGADDDGGVTAYVATTHTLYRVDVGGNIISSASLHTSYPHKMVCVNDKELEIYNDMDLKIDIYDPETLRCWQVECLSDAILDKKYGQYLFQDDYGSLAIRPDQDEDTDLIRLPVPDAFVDYAEVHPEVYGVLSFARHQVFIHDTHVRELIRTIEVDGKVYDVAHTDNTMVICHSSGFDLVKIF